MILVFGSINVDLVFAVPALPRAGETVLGPSYTVVPGGKGANQAVAAARDGATVRMVGAVGRDAFGKIAIEAMAGAGVDVKAVAATDRPTGCAAIGVDPQGRNQIMVAAGANAAVRADAVPDEWLDAGTTVLLQMEAPPQETAALIARAAARGARVVLNLAPVQPLDPAALRAVDVLVVNEGEAAALAAHCGRGADGPADLARRLADLCNGWAVLTLGGAGAVAAGRDGTWSVGVLPVTPVDTTAAGDAFVGVLAAALDRGRPMPEALRRASVAGGLACLTLGAQPSLPAAAGIDAALPGLPPPVRRPP